MTAREAKSVEAEASRSPILTPEAALERARELAPRFEARATATEAARSVPAESIRELVESGLFGVAVPRRWGGSELGFDSWISITAEIAAAGGSTGWVYGVLLGHDYLVASLPEAAQREVFGDRALVASLFRLGGSVTRVDGGYLWQDGRGRFCSGVDHVGWVIVRGRVAVQDGGSEQRYFLIPRSDFEIIDDWHTMGLRGTGSKSIEVKSPLFIPEHRTTPIDPTQARLFTLSLLGAPLGIARGAFDCFEGRLTQRKDDASPFFVRLARAGAEIDAAFALVLSAASRLAASTGAVESDFEWARQVRNNAYAVHRCQAAVNSLFEASGGSVVYESETFQRLWRDMNAAASHFVHYWEPAAIGYGEAALRERSTGRQ